MNPPESTENEGDQISWVWDHSQHHHHHHQSHQSHNHNPGGGASGVVAAMSIGLETRQFQGGGGRVLEYDWGSSPVLLSGGQGIPAQDTEERKPQIISAAAAGSVMDTIQYSGNGNGNVNLAVNGMLSSGFGHNIISPNSMGNLLMSSSSAGTRNTYGGHNHHQQHHHHHNNHHVLDSIRSSAPSPLLYSGGNSALSGFGSGVYADSTRAALEEHRNHILGLMGMDQKNIFHNIVKREDLCGAGDFQTRIGLNLGLGGRTYFSSEDNIVNRLYKRPRAISPGSQVPRCQAEGCKADLSTAKHYHRRHKVCELHSKAATVVSGGLTQRFCQQCSRFHVLSEFDEGKRSCRKRLADHNRRRRKPQPNAVVTVSNTESSSALKPTDQDQDTNSGSNQSSLQQPEVQISRSEPPGLLTGISLSQSLPLVLQTSKGQEQYLQQTGPNLSLGGEIALDYPRHSSGGENYNGLEIPIPWLRPAGSGSEFGGSEKNSSNGQLSESGNGGGSSSTVQVFTSIQNLLPLQSSTELGTSEWMVNGNLSGSSSRGQHYGSADLNLQTSLEGQQMLSLLEKDVRSSNTDRHNTEDAVEYFSQQQGLNSKNSIDGHSEHRNQLSSSFPGIQSLRTLSQSLYQNIL